MDLSQSDWKYVDERAGAFVGREWVFAQVRSFLSGPPGAFLLRGDPGTGKTAVAARLAQASCGRLDTADSLPPVGERTISAGVFCRAGKATVAELAQRLSDQLAASVDGFADALQATAEPGITIRDVRVDVHGDVHAGGTVSGVVLPRQDGKQAFSTGVAVPLRHLRERGAAEPIVLLVDAVDEAADVGEVNIFSRLLANLDDVHLIVTCRPDPSVLSDFRAAAQKLDLIADAPADDDDVRRYIRNRLTGQGPEEAVDVLAGRVSGEADGNFLYAFYVTGTLTGSGSLAGLDEKTARGLPLPTGGLAGVYEDFLDRQIAGDERRWAGELRPVLAPLAVAQDEGLTTEQLRLVAGRLAGEPVTRTAIREVTRMIRQFLDGPAPDGPFRVYHQSFADFLLDPEQNPDFLIDAAETHEAIVAAYAATDPLSWDSYARRNLALHASKAGQLDHLLEDARFLLAADPARLVPHLDAARSAPARSTAAVYRQSAHHLTPLDPPERASQLELTAHQLGYRALAACIASAAPDRPWQTRWSHGHQATDQQVLTGHDGYVYAVAVGMLPDGAPVIISGGGDGTVRVWRTADGTPAGEPLTGHDGAVRAVAAGTLPDGTPVIISGGQDGTVRVWRTADGTPVGEPLTGHDGAVRAVAAGTLPDGTPVIISGSEDRTVRVWRTADGTPVGEPLTGHDGAVYAVAAGTLPDGTPVIISGGGDGMVRVWRTADGTPVGEPLTGDDDTVIAVAAGVLPDGTPVIISGDGWAGAVRVWRTADGTPVGEPLTGHRSPVVAVAAGMLPDGTPVIISGAFGSGAVRVLRTADGTPVGEPLTGHDGLVEAVAAGVLPDGAPVIISGGSDGTVRVWRMADGTPVGDPLTGHDGPVRAVAAGTLPDGTPVIISGSWDGTVRLWRTADGTPVGEPLTGHGGGWVEAVAAGVLPDGAPVIISGGNDGTVRVWRMADGTPVGDPLTGHDSAVAAVAAGVLPDGAPVIISGGNDGTVRVWRMADGTPVGDPLTGHDDAVVAVAASTLPDGTPVIISGGNDRTVRVWRMADGTPVGDPLTGHDGDVFAVAAGVLPDGTPVIISGSSDRTVRVWRIADGTPVVPPLDLAESVQAVAVHGNVIITAAGVDIAVHQPAFPRPTVVPSPEQRPAGERPDNGRLSGTSADVRQSSGERPPAAARATRARYPVHLLRRSKMTGKIMSLRERDASTIQAAADAFLSSPRYASPNTRRGYTGVLDRLLAGLDASRPLAEVSGEELADLLEQLWGRCAPATWNRNRGAVTAWLSWCAANRLPAPVLPASAERRREHLNATRAVSRPAIDRALTRRDVPLREKTLWRMLYETAARASEVLALNIDDLDLDARRAPVRSKGGDTEWICWGSGTAHLLPRLIRGRQAGPVFLSERRPGPARRPAAKDLCPATGRARLGYDRARILFTRYTGWELHQLRHSAATHLGEQGIPLQLIMAKTRHRNPRTAMRYVRPGAEAVAEITALLEPPLRRG